MTDELLKMLKDAGLAGEPTLDKLVVSCDKYFWSLRRTPDAKWIATGRITKKDSPIPYYETTPYDAPDIAIAELYLAIKVSEREAAEQNPAPKKAPKNSTPK